VSALGDLTAAVVAAAEQRDAALAAADRVHSERVGTAAAALQDALERHDALVAEADADLRAATETASSAAHRAIASAEEAFDSEMRRQHGADDARVEKRHGVLLLKVGRDTLASATPVGQGHWRVNVGPSIQFVSDAGAARRQLWTAVAPDAVPA
jgi:hypothetical protein